MAGKRRRMGMENLYNRGHLDDGVYDNGGQYNFHRLYEPYHYIRKGHESEDWERVADVWCHNIAPWAGGSTGYGPAGWATVNPGLGPGFINGLSYVSGGDLVRRKGLPPRVVADIPDKPIYNEGRRKTKLFFNPNTISYRKLG